MGERAGFLGVYFCEVVDGHCMWPSDWKSAVEMDMQWVRCPDGTAQYRLVPQALLDASGMVQAGFEVMGSAVFRGDELKLLPQELTGDLQLEGNLNYISIRSQEQADQLSESFMEDLTQLLDAGM